LPRARRRGRPPEYVTEPMQSMLVRVSIRAMVPTAVPTRIRLRRSNPEPGHSGTGTAGRRSAARLGNSDRHPGRRRGGEPAYPVLVLASRVRRVGPAGDDLCARGSGLVGVGLLNAVSEDSIRRVAAQEKRNGLRGRPNLVWDLIEDARRWAVSAGKPTSRA
jgi:CxxC motif-containing protein (DUF1111 family)